MRYSFVLPLIVAVLLTSSESTSEEAPLVYLIGDSEAFLLQYELKPLVEKDGYRFQSDAVAGSSVIQWSQGLHRHWARMERAKPALLIVSLGANDACMGEHVVKNEPPYLKRFLKRAERTGAKVVWWGPPEIGSPSKLPQAKAGIEAFKKMVIDAGVHYVDARLIKVGMWNDQLHCSRPQYPGDKSDGCRTWATWAWSLVKPFMLPAAGGKG